MFDLGKIGRQIAILRKEKGLTGEKLAELLEVSPQAVSKWENGKCLPETLLLPELAKALDCNIDTLLVPKELIILEAYYTDGLTSVNVTHAISNHIHDNRLNICVNGQFVGSTIDSDRLKLITVKYQIPSGTYFTFTLQNENLTIDMAAGQANDTPYKLIGAFYGNTKRYVSAMERMEHYEYFKWDRIHVNHSVFPSNTASDDTEYLTLIYLNNSGIHAVSCAENDSLYYRDNRTSFYLKDNSTCILSGIMVLEWGENNTMPCTWAGALCTALKYMGETYSYEQIMGMSGACYRIAFCEIWDWSALDALIGFSYDMPLYDAIGYEPVWANRLEKEARYEERNRIVSDIQQGKPIIAINLRVTHEWGVITGYKDNGNVLYCRTYFDKDKLNENKDYLETDNWPFLITHFGEKKSKPSDLEILKASLRILIEAFEIKVENGYFQGEQGYEKWIEGIKNDTLWSENEHNPKGDIFRRIDVNKSTVYQLVDSRRCASKYLSECVSLLPEEKAYLLTEMSAEYKNIAHKLNELLIKLNTGDYHFGNLWQSEQVALLEWILNTEREIVKKAKKIIL